MKIKWLWLLSGIPLLLAAPVLLALGPAPYPTGAVTFTTYPHEPGVVVPGERLKYRFSWNGIDAAEAVWETKPAPGRPGVLSSRADGITIGYPSTIFSANDNISSLVRADDFKPEAYSVRIRESFDYYDMTVKFNQLAGIADRTKVTRSDSATKSFEFTNAYDPVGLALLVRSMPWKTGDERRFEVIDGNDRFLFVLQGGAVERITVPAGSFRAIRLIPSIFKLPRRRRGETAPYWEKQKQKDQNGGTRITDFTFWMALDPPRPFLRVRTDVFFGHVDMDLVEISSPPAPR